jgi:hypothetical protein
MHSPFLLKQLNGIHQSISGLTVQRLPKLNHTTSTKLGSFGTSLVPFQIEEGKSATQIVGKRCSHSRGLVVLGDTEPNFQMNTYLMRSLSSIT